MKTITRNDNDISLYIFDDVEIVSVNSDETVVGFPKKLTIDDCNSSNVTLHENVTPPEDWFGWKYLFDGAEWILNPNWVEPTVLEQ